MYPNGLVGIRFRLFYAQKTDCMYKEERKKNAHILYTIITPPSILPLVCIYIVTKINKLKMEDLSYKLFLYTTLF
jgi:hypothetical protein